MEALILPVVIITVIVLAIIFAWNIIANAKRRMKEYERGLKMVPMLIHLPPATDDVAVGGRDERDVTEEAISEAQVMYSIIASTVTKGLKSKVYGQRHLSFEIIAAEGMINYYAVVPAVLTETIKQAITAAYPTARLEETEEANIFSKEGGMKVVAGGELSLKEDYEYPIAGYTETKRDASVAIINALSVAKKGDGIAIQILVRPTDGEWAKKIAERVTKIKSGDKRSGSGFGFNSIGYLIGDLAEALWKPPDVHEKEAKEKVLTNLEIAEVEAMEGKTRYPGFEVLIRVLASSNDKGKSEGLLGGVVSAFAQFDAPQRNGFQYDAMKDMDKMTEDYIFRFFPIGSNRTILNSVELASIFHLPAQSVIPTSQVQKQTFKQVDGPPKLVEEGILLGVNEFRGERKEIRLSENDRRRHTYIIGATGMGKSVLLTNIAYQDMCDGRGFAFIDPHGDAAESLLARVPAERVDDVIYFDPGDIEHPMGLNMFEFDNPDQKDFIVQETINMLQGLYDPQNQGIFGPRAHHMLRNAMLLLMSDPEGATFIDIPRCFIDPEFVKAKMRYVTDKTVYDYWTKEFPQSQRSNDAGEVITWFVSKWGPFISNAIMKNTMGQVKSAFNVREVMDSGKILLVNLSKGKMGDLNSNLLGMILVMKFQAAAMSRQDILEEDRKDFCLFVDEFQNYATESFESILSEARKYRLNLVVANQFMTQLTDKIREGIIGNVGTILSGRLGVTDAELMEKVYSPTFKIEDLQKLPNRMAISRVMMFDMPSAPFTMILVPPMGEENKDLLASMRVYSSTKYGRMRAEVDREIAARLGAGGTTESTEEAAPKEKNIAPVVKDVATPVEKTAGHEKSAREEDGEKRNFLDNWLKKKEAVGKRAPLSKPVAVKNTTMKGVEKKNEEPQGLVAKKTEAPQELIEKKVEAPQELIVKKADASQEPVAISPRRVVSEKMEVVESVAGDDESKMTSTEERMKIPKSGASSDTQEDGFGEVGVKLR